MFNKISLYQSCEYINLISKTDFHEQEKVPESVESWLKEKMQVTAPKWGELHTILDRAVSVIRQDSDSGYRSWQKRIFQAISNLNLVPMRQEIDPSTWNEIAKIYTRLQSQRLSLDDFQDLVNKTYDTSSDEGQDEFFVEQMHKLQDIHPLAHFYMAHISYGNEVKNFMTGLALLRICENFDLTHSSIKMIVDTGVGLIMEHQKETSFFVKAIMKSNNAPLIRAFYQALTKIETKDSEFAVQIAYLGLDQSEAMAALKKASQLGSSEANFLLYRMNVENYTERSLINDKNPFYYYQRYWNTGKEEDLIIAAEGGVPAAQSRIALLFYREELESTSIDKDKADQWILNSVQKGDSNALLRFAKLTLKKKEADFKNCLLFVERALICSDENLWDTIEELVKLNSKILPYFRKSTIVQAHLT